MNHIWRNATTRRLLGLMLVFLALLAAARAEGAATMNHAHDAEPVRQRDIRRVKLMPNLPQPYQMRDWKQVARGYDAFVFDLDKQGEHLPLIWWDDSRVNYSRRGFALPSYVGHTEQIRNNAHESINCVGALLGATLVGIDKSNQNGHNFVAMCGNYFNRANGLNMFANSTNNETGHTFWYELFPNVVMLALMDRYDGIEEFEPQMRSVADRCYDMCVALGGRNDPPQYPDFNYTAFDHAAMQPVNNGKWIEPDAAAAVGWIEYMAWRKFGDQKYLDATRWCLAYLTQRKSNPSYEVLLPYGVYLAARFNAEQADSFDVEKLLNWCFEPSDARYGWGVIADRWGAFDCHGLAGSITDGNGYAFAMNTYTMVATLLPVARYDARYARTIGKWVLNAANAARLFYGNAHDAEHQTCKAWLDQYGAADIITYEGLRKKWKGVSPKAMGDPLVHGWALTDLAMYGSSYVGMLAAAVETTDVEGILQLDCRATEYYHDKAYPTYLYYNPHADAHEVTVPVNGTCDFYDAVQRRFVARDVRRQGKLRIAPETAVLLVLVPSGGSISYTKHGKAVDGVVIDYHTPQGPCSGDRFLSRQQQPENDHSRKIQAPRKTITVDGAADDWRDLTDDVITMDTAPAGDMKVAIRYAWDRDYLYILVEERPGDSSADEADTAEQYAASAWNHDGISFFFDTDNSNDGEIVGDFNLWLGFSSRQQPLMCGRSHRPAEMSTQIVASSHVATSGQWSDGNRVIEAALSWRDLAQAIDKARQPKHNLVDAVEAGLHFGCDPLLMDDNWKHQAFIGGERRPSGLDKHSCDVVLTAP